MDPINPPNPPNILSTTTMKPKTTTPDNPETEPTTPLNLETEPQDPTPDALSTTTKKPKRTTPLSLETTTVSTMLSHSSKICYQLKICKLAWLYSDILADHGKSSMAQCK